MEGKEQDRKIRPGLPEALHPELGNGSAFEKDPHSLLLRLPDPSKTLDELFSEPGLPDRILTQWKKNLEAGDDEQPHLPESKVSKKKDLPQGNEPKAAIITKAVKTDFEKEIPNLKPEKEKKKPPKAGKLVRKAAKAEKEKMENSEKPQAEEGLSPFTQWLRGLKSSEYVHPYDDDFALNQGTEGEEGISETFADLLASQGHKARAVEMYKKLMEKYPEKSGFFAAKIEELR